MKKAFNEFKKDLQSEFFKYVFLPIFVVLGTIFLHGFYLHSVKAHTPAVLQRIREDDGFIVWKFQDSVSDCYITANRFYQNTSNVGVGISCVKR